MDVVQKQINNGYSHPLSIFENQTWNDFHNAVSDKHIFLFGLGKGAEFFSDYYKIKIEGIIDNDKSKVGKKVQQYADVDDNLCQNEYILSPDVLRDYSSDEVIVLITCLKYFGPIASQLDDMGIKNYYSLMSMEYNKRLHMTADEIESEYDTSLQNPEINDKKIVFFTMNGYNGHGKYIAEKLMKMRDDLEIAWGVNDLSMAVPEGISCFSTQCVRRFIREMSGAKIWVYDDMLPTFITKKPGQIYIQVKHWASVTLKTFGFDLADFRNDDGQKIICGHNSESIDYIITGSDFDIRTCRSGFRFNGPFLNFGSARSDALFDGSLRQKVYDHFSIDHDKKLLLYTPTFRSYDPEKYNPEAYDTNIDYDKLKESLEKCSENEWVIMIKLHPVVAKESASMKLPDYVIDASFYQDSQELVSACDMMIADYSSIMFEPAFVCKPVFLYAPDRHEYIDGERGLLIDYDTLPFPIAETNEQLAANIMNFDNEKYVRDVDAFMEKYDVHEDGHASERAAKFISDLIDGKVE